MVTNQKKLLFCFTSSNRLGDIMEKSHSRSVATPNKMNMCQASSNYTELQNFTEGHKRGLNSPGGAAQKRETRQRQGTPSPPGSVIHWKDSQNSVKLSCAQLQPLTVKGHRRKLHSTRCRAQARRLRARRSPSPRSRVDGAWLVLPAACAPAPAKCLRQGSPPEPCCPGHGGSWHLYS